MTIGRMENVEVFTSEGKGRGLKAPKEFCAADVIFAERAYAAVVFDRYEMWTLPSFLLLVWLVPNSEKPGSQNHQGKKKPVRSFLTKWHFGQLFSGIDFSAKSHCQGALLWSLGGL